MKDVDIRLIEQGDIVTLRNGLTFEIKRVSNDPGDPYPIEADEDGEFQCWTRKGTNYNDTQPDILDIVAVHRPGVTRTVKYFSDIGHSPAWKYVPDAMFEMISSGHAENPHEAPHYRDPVLVLFEDDKVAGFIVYRHDERRSGWWIMLSYTIPDFRQDGVNSELFTALVERAKLRGDILSIGSGVSVRNDGMNKAAVAQGRVAVGIIYEFRIRETIEGKAHTDVN